MGDLTDKQTLFVAHYVTCWNATEAAKRAGYSEKTARSIGAENLTKPDIDTAIKAHIAAIMPAGEVLTILADQARGTLADFFKLTEEEVVLTEVVTVKGYSRNIKRETVKRSVARLDMQAAADAGKLHLVKKYSLSDKGISIELYDAQAAAVHIGRYHKLFVDRQEITGKDGEPIQIEDARQQLAGRLARYAQADVIETDSGGAQ